MCCYACTLQDREKHGCARTRLQHSGRGAGRLDPAVTAMSCVVSHAPVSHLRPAGRLLAVRPCTVRASKSVAHSCCCHCV